MEIVKDLTPELIKLEGKDRFYQIKGSIVKMLAPQDPHFVREYVYRKNGWGKIERVEAKTDGSPTDQTAPRRKLRTRKGEVEIKTASCWSFDANNGTIRLPWAGSFGLFKQAWRRTLEAKGNLEYVNAKLDLMRVYPSILKVKGPIDTLADGQEPAVILTPRNTTRSASIRVEEFFDCISNRPIDFFVEVDSESPINEERGRSDKRTTALQSCVRTGSHALEREPPSKVYGDAEVAEHAGLLRAEQAWRNPHRQHTTGQPLREGNESAGRLGRLSRRPTTRQSHRPYIAQPCRLPSCMPSHTSNA